MPSRKLLLFLFATLTLAFLTTASVKAANVTIDTTPANLTISTFGFPNTATYGQTITTPASATNLVSFGFNINPSTPVTFRLFVMAWNGTMATGPVLFQSGDITTAGSGFYSANTGGLALTGGGQYVLFASISNNYVPTNGTATFGGRSDNPYAGGGFFFNNNSGNFGALSTTAWSSFSGVDLAFVANFTDGAAAVPEPASLFLLGTGLAGTVGAIRRRRRRG